MSGSSPRSRWTAQGTPASVYLDYTHGDLKYTWRDGTGWQAEAVDSAGSLGEYTSLALDGTGKPRISYYDSTNDDLKYAWRDGTGWHAETVDSAGNVGMDTFLALDGAGNPRIDYFDYTNGDLKYANGTNVFFVPGGSALPTDTDADGFYDDVNGNNRKDFADVVLYFNQMSSDPRERAGFVLRLQRERPDRFRGRRLALQ